MFRFVSSVARKTACAGIVAASLFATATMAQTAPATGLGQAWPNAVDQSANPNWHVYVFERDGVRYVQVNDRNGNVHAAIGRAGDTLFALPVGVDAQHVDVASTSNSATSAQMVYQDDSTTVTAEPQRDGSEQIVAHISTCESGFCSGGSVYLSYQ
jgi:hypothetical protein